LNLILENSKYVKYYTYLDSIFSTVLEFQEMNWVISDVECNQYPDPRISKDPILIDGKSLNEIVQNNKIQFIWAVLSGYREKVLKIPEQLPYADGNPDFWTGKPTPQADDAEIEIVCWDSTCTLFINASTIVSKKLKKLYPDIKDLDEENEKRS
jgi:hypothetical protein